MAGSNSSTRVTYRTVPGFPKYRVGDDGSVWSQWKHPRNPDGKWKRLSFGSSGYPEVHLRSRGRNWHVRVHVLVLLVFIGPCPPGMEACHDNDIKSDCRLSNLRWGTRLSNRHDAVRNGKTSRGSNRPLAKMTEGDIPQIIAWRHVGRSLRWIAEQLGVKESQVSLAYRGLSWKHVPR